MNESDFDFLKENLMNFPELKDAFFNPMKNSLFRGKIVKMNKSMTGPLLICDNPDTHLPKIPMKLNIIVPPAMRKSKENYFINFKNGIKKYKELYELNSIKVNEIIEETKQCLKNLYNPLKSLSDEVKAYTNNFEYSINQLTIPLTNWKNGLDKIDYTKYPKSRQNDFINEKKEVIKEMDNFLKEANDFYIDYGQLNKATSDDINNFVERFNKLVMPTKELTIFMRSLMKAFERSYNYLNDIKYKKRIGEAFKKIREPINEFYYKNNIEDLLYSIKNIKIERLNEMIEKSKCIKGKISKLEERSKKISEKIKKIREKYGEPERKLEEVDIPMPPLVNSKMASDQMEKVGEKIENSAYKGFTILKKDIKKIKDQNRLDLLFILDISNGMDDYLDQVRNNILRMISTIEEECAGIEIYLGFVGYRDFNDLDLGDEYINLEFTTDYESIKNNIEFVTASGGGDTPEDLCGGLELAINKFWKGKTRLAFLVTDSPCHGKKYHDLTGDQEDNYPEGDREGRNIEDYIKFFAQNEISLLCLKINSTTDKMFKIFEEVYNNNKDKNSKSQFALVKKDQLFYIVTENAIKMFQNRGKLDLK